MLPRKISSLVQELRIRTENGELSWDLDANESAVSSYVSPLNIDVTITYRFDTIEEVGTFRVDIYERNTSQSLIFHTSQMYTDYEQVRSLFDSAQASGFNFSF